MGSYIIVRYIFTFLFSGNCNKKEKTSMRVIHWNVVIAPTTHCTEQAGGRSLLNFCTYIPLGQLYTLRHTYDNSCGCFNSIFLELLSNISS